jgi:mannose-6-phosphate isomerase-like protein (cupin superfamily)
MADQNVDRRKLLQGSVGVALASLTTGWLSAVSADTLNAAPQQTATTPPTSQPRARRVLTGNNSEGKSYIVSDEIVSGGAITMLFETSADNLLGKAAPGESTELLPSTTPQIEPALGGSKFEFVTLPPHKGNSGGTAMHRSWTVDYNVVLSGELILTVETGEVTLKPGDVAIQRNAIHSWRNNSTTEPVHWIAVLIPAHKTT